MRPRQQWQWPKETEGKKKREHNIEGLIEFTLQSQHVCVFLCLLELRQRTKNRRERRSQCWIHFPWHKPEKDFTSIQFHLFPQADVKAMEMISLWHYVMIDIIHSSILYLYFLYIIYFFIGSVVISDVQCYFLNMTIPVDQFCSHSNICSSEITNRYAHHGVPCNFV